MVGIINRVDGLLFAQKSKAAIYHDLDQCLMEIKLLGFLFEGLSELSAPCHAAGSVAAEKVELRL